MIQRIKMNRNILLQTCLDNTRWELQSQIETIFQFAEDDDLIKLWDIVEGGKPTNLIFIEIDFIVSKLRYFGKLDKNFKTDFGFTLDLIPELVAKWRNEKLNNLGISQSESF